MAGVELATAYVQLTVSTRGLQDEITRQLRGAGGGAGGAGAAAGRTYANRLSTAAKVGLVGLAGGLGVLGGGIAAVFKTGADEQSDFLKGQAQLVAGVKSTGGAAGVSVNQMEELAGSIQGMSGQTDDSVVAAEQLLLTFTSIKNTKTDKIFDQATLAAANMAAKMGGDASSKAIQLGKALNDPVKGVTALARVGVSFTAAQKKQIAAMVKTGDVVGAQKIILKELNTEFGGAAKAAGQSLPGQMARAKRSFEDISQSVLAGMMPVLTKLADWLTKTLIPAFKRLVEWVQANWPAIQAVIVNAWTNYIRPVFAAIGTFIMTKVIPAVQAVVAFVVAHWPQIQAAFKLFWDTVKPVLAAFENLLLTVWHSVIQPLVAWIKAHWPQISAVIKVVMIAVAVAFKIVMVAAALLFKIIAFNIRATAAIFGWLWHNIVAPVFNGIVTVIRGAAAIIKGIINGVGAVIKGIGGFFHDAYTSVKTWIGSLVGFVAGLPGKISRAVSGMWDGIKDSFKAVINWVIRGWNTLNFKMPTINTHIPGVGKIGGFNIGLPQIPELARGGLTDGVTAAILGDNRSGRELVMPMDSPATVSLLAAAMAKAGGGNGGVTVNQVIHNPVAEPASRSGPAGLRRAAYALGAR